MRQATADGASVTYLNMADNAAASRNSGQCRATMGDFSSSRCRVVAPIRSVH